MAHKSKTQRKRAHDRKVARQQAADQRGVDVAEIAPVKEASEVPKQAKAQSTVPAKKEDPKLVAFLKDVRLEMGRVTWPTRENVAQWSGIVVAALLFFGIYVAGLDELVTMFLVGFTGLAG